MKDGTGLQMSLPRMVTKPLASLFWTFALFSIAIAADQFKFTGHLARFVPNCASGCLVSFLNDNFAETSCDTTTSLECLCAETGTSGFTIGEGAVQCIEAEQSIGSCAAGEIDRNTIDTAYFMCSDLLKLFDAVLIGDNIIYAYVSMSHNTYHNSGNFDQGGCFIQ
ncbi:hypothetical protein VD0002_g5560 [Verticillium dahliae]|uniref:Uncharacterized protein n=2 Tax=Verticillium TaxID=1036719 RepID=A0A2J8DID7_VERDA|nr:hypothetical protein VD0004_g7549 [Verticillium dahliae]PNH48991.1 hypothetical protein VD0003_g8153 [Verticillium dahliae]PNH62527.1 hypothetical protein VD0002_g5560 [Verticillium dahliae]PNH71758.1 hypothetical protein VD0001_g5791 [Verticillium dahliae]RXG47660.1 hypothetical protein VDGE_30732 [Verticillium dahliae]